MTVVETAAEDLFVGLEHAEQRVESVAVRRATHAAIACVIVGVEMAWLAAFAYAASIFIF